MAKSKLVYIPPLILEFRPKKFSEVIGKKQKLVVTSLQGSIDEGTSRAFIFSGPPGLGKTTLARLAAEYVGAGKLGTLEVDGANFNSVDDMREILVGLDYKPLTGAKAKAFIIDECHRMSNAAWTVLLKPVEEPPAHVYWFFCTTDFRRVPENIQSRCFCFHLDPVSNNDLSDFLKDIVYQKYWETPDEVVALCVRHSEGSPRKALSLLALCYAAETREEAFTLIDKDEATNQGPGIELARALANNGNWKQIQPILEKIKKNDDDPNATRITAEGIRHTVQSYFTTVAIGSKDEQAARYSAKVLDAFSTPYNTADGLSPLVLSVCRCLFSGEI